MGTLERLGAGELRGLILGYRDALRLHQEALNRLNVYPVPDGDTGTNMALTLESVVLELNGEASDDVAAVCQAISHGSLMGARGNSGVILSQILRGMSGVFAAAGGVDGSIFRSALSDAAAAAYQAVMRPVEGTILTVVRESSEAIADHPGTLVEVLHDARLAAASSLERTPDLLPVLATAGVVDAGGAGFVLLLDAALSLVDGRPLPEPDVPPVSAAIRLLEGAAMASALGAEHGAGPGAGEGDVSDLRYEVMYFLEAPDEAVPAFKEVWSGIGDSIVVVGGGGIWNCHIHTNDIGAAIEAAVDIGKPTKIRVTDLQEQVEEERWVREAGPEPPLDEPTEPVTTAVVAVCVGAGLERLFRSYRVRPVRGGQTMNPSTAQLLAAVESVPARQVIILPNNKNIIPVAEQVEELTSKKVRVLPTRGAAEALSALLAYDPEADVDSNLAAMAGLAEGVIAGEITRAVRPSACDLGPIAEGDYLGICRSGIRSVAPALRDAACGLLESLIEDHHEIVTILVGDGATAGDTRAITEWIGEHWPGVSAEVHEGGQPLYPYLFGIE